MRRVCLATKQALRIHDSSVNVPANVETYPEVLRRVKPEMQGEDQRMQEKGVILA
jgi:hypothetical protein